MAVTATVSVSGSITGLGIGTISISAPNITSSAAVGEHQVKDLTSGDNTITIPTGTKAILLTPPAGNTANLTLKGAAGDTGIILHPTNPTLWSPRSSATSFILNASATVDDLGVLFV